MRNAGVVVVIRVFYRTLDQAWYRDYSEHQKEQLKLLWLQR